MVGVFRALTLTRQVWFMYFQVESPENGTKNIFKDKQTTKKVPLMFSDVKFVLERQELRFWTLSTSK